MGLASQRQRLAGRIAAQRAEMFGTDSEGEAITIELAPARATVFDDLSDGVRAAEDPRGGTTYVFSGIANGLQRRAPQASDGGGFVFDHDGRLRWLKSLGVRPENGDLVRVLAGNRNSETHDGAWMRVEVTTNNAADPEWTVGVSQV